MGGFAAGVVGVIVGFLVYDWFFLPPYNTLTVRSPENWVALVVYAVVVLIVAQVVAKLQERTGGGAATDRGVRAAVRALPAPHRGPHAFGAAEHIVATVQSVFAPRWTALVLPETGQEATAAGEPLRVAATAGQPLSDGEWRP